MSLGMLIVGCAPVHYATIDSVVPTPRAGEFYVVSREFEAHGCQVIVVETRVLHCQESSQDGVVRCRPVLDTEGALESSRMPIRAALSPQQQTTFSIEHARTVALAVCAGVGAQQEGPEFDRLVALVGAKLSGGRVLPSELIEAAKRGRATLGETAAPADCVLAGLGEQ